MGTSATVYFSIEHEGQARALSSQAWSDGYLDGVGRMLWLGSNGIEEQTRLCSLYGGYLPMMDYDGSFIGWFESDSVDPESSANNMWSNKPYKGIERSTLFKWMQSLAQADSSDELPDDFEKLLSEVPLPKRLGGKLHFGEGNSALLPKESPSQQEVFGSADACLGSPKKPLPILVGEESAAIIARTMQEIDEDCEVADFLSIGGSYFHAQGCWLTTLEYAQSEDPILSERRARTSRAIWIPISQALAIAGDFDESIVEFLSGHAGPNDRKDILDLAKAVPAERFFQGDGAALAWAQSQVLGESAKKPKAKGRKVTL